MRIRKQALGDKNIVGSKIESRRIQMGMKQRELLEALNTSDLTLNLRKAGSIELNAFFV